MCVFLGGNEISNYYDNNMDCYSPYFSIGKFFLFISLGNSCGIKILYCGKKKSKEKLKRVISIQKLLFESGLAFDCNSDILNIKIMQMDPASSRSYFGYLTGTEINCKRIEKHFLGDIPYRIEKVLCENNIARKHLSLELRKTKNYVLTDYGLKLVDIDPKFYYA